MYWTIAEGTEVMSCSVQSRRVARGGCSIPGSLGGGIGRRASHAAGTQLLLQNMTNFMHSERLLFTYMYVFFVKASVRSDQLVAVWPEFQ